MSEISPQTGGNFRFSARNDPFGRGSIARLVLQDANASLLRAGRAVHEELAEIRMDPRLELDVARVILRIVDATAVLAQLLGPTDDLLTRRINRP